MILVIILLAGNLNSKNSDSNFELNTVLLKSVIEYGEDISSVIKITNVKNFEQEFSVRVNGLDGLVDLNDDNFVLNSGESKELIVSFYDKELNYLPNVYVGELIVEGDLEIKKIPIILDVESKDVLFSTRLEVNPDYKSLKKGESMKVGVKIFNLNDSLTHSIKISYIVKNLDSDIITSNVENIAVGGSEASFTKMISFPDDIKLGDYVFVVLLDDGKKITPSSFLFSIEKDNLFVFNNNMFVLFVFIFLFAILILVFYMVYERNKLFLELRKQHNQELNLIVKGIDKRKRSKVLSVKSSSEKKKIGSVFNLIKKKVVKKINQKYKKRKSVFKKLIKHKKKNVMLKKLNEWKKQGFDVHGLGLDKSTEKSVEDEVKSFGKKGYDVSVLK